MAATYTPISQREMEEVLLPLGFEQIKLPGTMELVYAKRVDINGNSLSLRVNTAIDPSGLSRDVGSDAIRVGVIYRAGNAWEGKTNLKYPPQTVEIFPITRMVGKKEIRVHRTQNWRKSLAKRIANLMERIDCPPCSHCGCPTFEKQTKKIDGQEPRTFYSCCRFPHCTGSGYVN